MVRVPTVVLVVPPDPVAVTPTVWVPTWPASKPETSVADQVDPLALIAYEPTPLSVTLAWLAFRIRASTRTVYGQPANA